MRSGWRCDLGACGGVPCCTLVQHGSEWPQRSAAETNAFCCCSSSSWTSWKTSAEQVGRLHSTRGGVKFEEKVFLEKLLTGPQVRSLSLRLCCVEEAEYSRGRTEFTSSMKKPPSICQDRLILLDFFVNTNILVKSLKCRSIHLNENGSKFGVSAGNSSEIHNVSKFETLFPVKHFEKM